ncbi:PhzF family phenazine biosynthesis protein [Methylocapsa sp. S129]|uniref:PhzF family phenazine biosynthesis protein n=1 Tax=Methylocapsa sp. S129 TaxID=1641869 RepID=UPI00131D01E0|nr:PhzF family phenazine biosynthesis isomerase [Methylocapsa sp. S129]
MTPQVQLVSVFAAGPHGGNPAPIVADASGMSDADMQDVARFYGHESGFVLPAPADSGCDFAVRFWVPNHEMEMCGHATVGAVWLLLQLGRLPRDRVSIWTRSGRVDAHVDGQRGDARVEITQPQGKVARLPDGGDMEAEILSVLGIASNELAPLPIQNASTSRVKTLVPLKSAAVLDGLWPDFQRVEKLCERIGSTGLYPYAPADLEARVFDARQFPKSSGYPEDAATGIAAAALAFGLLENGLVEADDRPIRVRQGRAMGRPSEIALRFRLDAAGRVLGCWLGGSVRLEAAGVTTPE